MTDTAPIRLKLRSAAAEFDYEGGEALLQDLLPRLLSTLAEASPAAANQRLKADLLEDVAQLEQELAGLVGAHERLTQLNAELAALHDKTGQGVAQFAQTAARALDRPAAVRKALQQLQEMQMSFNQQYLQLQQQMQDESRRFTLLSNIMKTKHDTVKNSISNIR